jgi:hypothetical protein
MTERGGPRLPTETRKPRRTFAVRSIPLPLLVALGLTLGACSGSKTPDAKANIPTAVVTDTAVARTIGSTAAETQGSASADGSGITTTTPSDPAQARLGFAKCMRENGVAMEDPKADGSMNFPQGIDQTKVDSAQAKCAKFIQGAGGTGKLSQAEMQDKMTVLAKCMRAEGISDFPDPKVVNGAVSLGGAEFDPNDPKIAAAIKVCAKKADLGGPGGIGG